MKYSPVIDTPAVTGDAQENELPLDCPFQVPDWQTLRRVGRWSKEALDAIISSYPRCWHQVGH